MILRFLPILILLDGLLSPPCNAQRDATGQLKGRTQTETGAPLGAVEITILDLSRTATSDTGGHFSLREIPPGEYVVRVRRIGFRAQRFSLRIEAGQPKEVSVVMEAGPYELPELKVTARSLKPIEYAYTHKYDDFFRRRYVGLGHYITRQDIERRQPLRTANLLVGIPGVYLMFRSALNTDVSISGCPSIGVWIDGFKQRFADLYRPPISRRDSLAIAVGDLLDRILPMRIEMVEVYRGASEMPAEFAQDECAIVIWAR